jgi:hypothetical protein
MTRNALSPAPSLSLPGWWRAALLLSSFLAASTSLSSFPTQEYEPYSLIQPNRIVGFFPFDEEPFANIAPTFDPKQARFTTISLFSF